jgi:ribonuclease HI
LIILKEIAEYINKLLKGGYIILHWIILHAGLLGNERADELAKLI